MQALKTFTNMPMAEALRELDRLLPVEAYKPINAGPGAKVGLTDINPTYCLELISELFGPLGLGWGYEELEFNRGEDNYCGIKIRAWFTLYDVAGNLAHKVEWTARGGNSNAGGNKEWAEKGALTNALGAAWSMQGLQSSVYKGLRGHQTVAAERRKLTGTTPQPEAQEVEIGVKTAPEVSATAEPPVAPEKPDTSSPSPTPSAGADTASKEAADMIQARLAAANVAFNALGDGILYALPKYGNSAQKKAVTDAGGKWDGSIPATVHQLHNSKAGAFLIKGCAA